MYNFWSLNSKVQQNSTLLCCFNFNLTPTNGFSNKIFPLKKFSFELKHRVNPTKTERIISQNEFFFKNLCCELCNRDKGFI
ncbi:MAG: hypothetical protein C4517_00685 [Stygiobacter sp.]|nr:MAG: hypothetical protein C4517_00685 [Stygiobacter sp.]